MMITMTFDGVAIAGAAEIPYARKARGITTTSLLASVFVKVLATAEIAHNEVDGIAVSSFTLKPDHAIDVAWQLGISPRWSMEDTHGGACGINMLQHAARAIQVGDANVIVILAGDHFQPSDFKDLVENYNRTTRDYLTPLQFGGPNALFALLTRHHMKVHGLDRSDYGLLCIAQREWARRNPLAVYRSELTLDEYLCAPVVADPLCRYDCVPVVSGANALVLTRGDRTPGKAVGIRALRCLYNPDHQEGDGLQTGLKSISERLWQDAGVGPAGIDLVSVYDDYPVMVLVQLADLGFIPDGDMRGFIRNRLVPRTLPVNTSGGQLSVGQAGTAGGLHGLVEAVLQLRGEAGERQIAQARFAAVSGYGMVQYRYGMCANAVLLEGSH